MGRKNGGNGMAWFLDGWEVGFSKCDWSDVGLLMVWMFKVKFYVILKVIINVNEINTSVKK